MATETRAERDVAGESVRRGRLRLFGSLCGLVFLVNLSRVAFAPLLEPLKSTFGLTAGGAGLVATLVWLGSALPRLPTGYLLTRVDRHRVVLGAGGTLAAGAAFTATAGSAAALYAGALTMGLSTGVYFIAANPLVSELFPDRVGKVIGIHGTAAQLAAAGAPLLVGGLLAAASWREVFWLIAAGAAAVTAGTYLAARRASLPSAGEDDRAFLAAVAGQWPIVLTGIAVVGATGFVWNALFNFYVSYLLEEGLTQGTARTLLTLVFAAGVPAFWFTGRLADRLPYVPLLLAILGAFVACLLALTVASTLPALAAVSLATGYAVHSLFPVIDTYLLDSLPDHHRASAYAVYSAAMMLAQAPGSVVVGELRDAGVGFDRIFRGSAVVLVAVLVALVVLYSAGRLPTGAEGSDSGTA